MVDWAFILLIALALVLAVASAAISGLETALFALREHHVRVLAGRNRRLRAMLRLLLSRKDENQVAILILSSALNLGAVVAAATALLGHRDDFAAPFGLWVAGVLALLVVIDIVAKLGALSRPVLAFRVVAPVFLASRPCTDRLARPLQRMVRALEVALVPAGLRRRLLYTEAEFGALVAMQREEGILDADESTVIAEIVKLGNKTAKDCMTSRVDAFTLPADLPKDELLRRIRARDCWKVPVYRESLDAITAVLDVPRALIHPERALEEAMTSPVFIPSTMPALNAFRDFLPEPHSLVVVLDEFGTTEGVLTHEDIIQEVTADVSGVGATPGNGTPPPEIRRLSQHRYLVTGSARLDEVSESLGVDLHEGDLDTIGGLIFTRLGYLPLAGERVDLGEARAVIRRTGLQRIEELILERRIPVDDKRS